jgi:hypothetical protein
MIDIEKEIQTYSPEQLAVLKHVLENSYMEHAKFFLALRENQPFITGQHHKIIADTMQRVFEGEIKRLVVNVSPSYTKTEMVVIQFSSFGFVNNPGCRFMHVSGGDTLPLDNSSKIKEQILHPVSQKLWGIKAREDTKAKGLWKTNKGGQFYAVSSGSKKIMGFRAGRSKPGFQGALLIDDPQAPEDFTPANINKFPEHYKAKIKSRVDNRDTPIIVVMQRLHEDDFSGWLLNGGTGEYWYHLCLPALIE